MKLKNVYTCENVGTKQRHSFVLQDKQDLKFFVFYCSHIRLSVYIGVSQAGRYIAVPLNTTSHDITRNTHHDGIIKSNKIKQNKKKSWTKRIQSNSEET